MKSAADASIAAVAGLARCRIITRTKRIVLVLIVELPRSSSLVKFCPHLARSSHFCLCIANMPSSRAQVVLLCQAFALTRAFSDITIVGQAGGAPQKLPGSYVKGFTRWSVEELASESPTLQRLPTEGDDSFVNPTSTEEVWWPMDISTLQARPCLDVLMQGGQPKYAMAGLTVRVPKEASSDGSDWRNYGLNSQPLAGQWTTFAFAVEGGFRVECFVGMSDAGDGTEANDAKKGRRQLNAL